MRPSRPRCGLGAALFALAVVGAVPAPAGERVGLVIANTRYAGLPDDPRGRADADSVATTLRIAGFAVETLHDPTQARSLAALAAFRARARGADWAVLFFSGRGAEQTYHAPEEEVRAGVAAAGETEPALSPELFAEILRALPAAHALVVFDACRVFPERRRATRSSLRSLCDAAFFADAPVTVFLAGGDRGFWTSAYGELATPFATAVARHLGRPGQSLRQAIQRIVVETVEATGRRLTPFLVAPRSSELDAILVPAR